MGRTKQTRRKRKTEDNESTGALAFNAKKAKKCYFSKCAAKQAKSLRPGLKGFIATCNFREKECIAEALNILNEYADKIYGEDQSLIPETQPQNKKIVFEDSDNEGDGDQVKQEVEDDVESKNTHGDDDGIEDELAREVDNLKQERLQNPSKRRFQIIESGADNCIFISSTVEDPVSVVQTVLEDIQGSSKQKSRFLLRLLPVEATCKAWPDDIKAASSVLLDKYFKGDPKTFCIIFKRRNNNNVLREELIQDLASEIKLRNPLHRADMKQPDLTVMVEAIRGICCLSVVPKYFHYRKYNLIELAKPKGSNVGDEACAVDENTENSMKEEEETVVQESKVNEAGDEGGNPLVTKELSDESSELCAASTLDTP